MAKASEEKPLDYQLIGPSDDGTINNLLADLAKPKDGRQRLQALIAEWLRMENLVVLTGAGCSCSSGGKLMPDLERAVLDAVAQASQLPDSVKEIINVRLVTSDKDAIKNIGFEDWLSYLANAYFIASSDGAPVKGVIWESDAQPTRDDLKWLIDRTGAAIFAECALPLSTTLDSKIDSEVPPHLPFLAKLVARDSNLGRAHLFTLNYDTLFEQALELLGIQYFDGFTGRANARFDPSVYGLDIYYPGEIAEGRVRRFDRFLHLYKLHGSIHWQVRNDELRARHPDLAKIADYRNLGAKAKGKRIDQLVEDLPSVGILPTANKFAQTLTMPFSYLFRSFQIRLGVPQTFLLVLGYGFSDDHVTKIIEAALMNPSLVMLVVEPNPNSNLIRRIREYKDLGKRAFVLTATEAAFDAKPYIAATFDEFARAIMPDVQWLDDFLRLRRFEKQIRASGGLGHDDITSTAADGD